MKQMGLLTAVCVALMFAATGCCTMHKSDSAAFQGHWVGNELTGGMTNGPCHLDVSGTKMDYHGVEANDWCKGTLIFVEKKQPSQMIIEFTDAPSADMVGKTCHTIYTLKDGTLEITGNAPGDAAVPASFDAPGARHFIFKKQ